jgi:small subunit ribosomal protein S17
MGIVTGDKTSKTRRVEIGRLVKHPKYGKYLRQRTVCYVHDADDQSHLGDLVEIEESRPLSRTKRWQLVRVVTKSRLIDVAALRSAARGRPRAEIEEEQAEAVAGPAGAEGPGADQGAPAGPAAGPQEPGSEQV